MTRITGPRACLRISAFVIFVLGLFSLKPALAGNNMYWVCDGGIWDSLCWSVGISGGTATATQPINGDYVFLTQSGSSNLVVTYRNTAYPSATLGSLTIDGSGTGTMTLSQETYSDPLQSAQETIGFNGLHIQSVGSNSTGTLGVGGYYSLSGSGSLVASNAENITGVFQQAGGTNSAGIVYVGSPTGSGTYGLTAGSLTAATEYFQGNGAFIQNGGINTVTNNFNMVGGSYNLSDGSFAANNVTIGGSGYPAFVQNGGAGDISGNLTLGTCAGDGGTYTLAGGTLSVAGGILRDTCGGAGILKIDGGTLTVGGGDGAITVYDFHVASTASSNGSHTLSGTGSLMATNEEYIGDAGVGTFHQNGGTNITPTLSIGTQAGSNGVYNLNGGTLTAGAVATGAGTSTLNIDGGVLSVGSTYDPTNSTGGATVPNNPNVFGGGNGSISVVNFNVGNAVNSNGNHALTGTGTITAVNETIGNSGTGTLTQTGGTNTVTNTLTLAANAGSSGTYNLNGGRLNAANITVNSGGTFNFNGGTLSVGQFTGDLANLGGTLAPGSSPGTTNITGNYGQSQTGTFAVEIGGTGPGQFDVLKVSGTATLDGTLSVSLFDLGSGLFTPHLGDSFDILTADLIQGGFSSLTLATLDPGLKWDISYLTDAIGTTDVVRLSVAAVPIPAGVWLFGSGLLGLVGVARRRTA